MKFFPPFFCEIFMKRFVLFPCVLVLTFLGVSAFAQEKPPKPAEYTSEAEIARDAALKRDFDIQGEYLGSFGGWTVGLNLIAEGGGKFGLVAFVGGLPGDGWQRGDIRAFGKFAFNDNGELEYLLEKVDDGNGQRPITTDDTEALHGVATFTESTTTVESTKSSPIGRQRLMFRSGGIRNSRWLVGRPQGTLSTSTRSTSIKPAKLTFTVAEKDYEFVKQYRESPTLGLKAPKGAIVLFADGKASDVFEKAELNEEAKTLWSEAWTKPFEKKPYSMHVEFLLSYMPTARGQARSNSGVYVDETYECQVLDSFGLEGENNECGGFYKVSAPKVNMCFPPLRWQTYDIDFVPATFDADGKKTANAIISVKHNGKLIHQEIRPEKETGGRKKETSEARGLYLQGHGNRVQYGNIWLKYAE